MHLRGASSPLPGRSDSVALARSSGRRPGGSEARHGEEDEGVSPVIGTILILGITVVGIVGLLVWGGPTVDRVQSQNAAIAMQGEFEGLRDASQELSVPDHSRFPAIALPRGALALAPGTRFLVSAAHDEDHPNCSLHVYGWGSSTATNQVTVGAASCRTLDSDNFEVSSVSGTTVTPLGLSVAESGPYTVTVPAADFSKGDWRFRITDGEDNPVVYAQAWLRSSDRITWRLVSATGDRDLFLEAGAIFARIGGTTFLEKAPPINDATFGEGYYGLWLRTYGALAQVSIDSPGTHQVFLALASNELHVDEDEVHGLRYTFSGDLAEAWCKTLLRRNPTLTDAEYTEDDDATCDDGDAQGLRSVTFARTGAESSFQFRFLHARIQASIVP